jgi:signal transduction histidine kinase
VYAQIEVAVNDSEYIELFSTSVTDDPWMIVEHTAIQIAQTHQREFDLQFDVERLASLPIVEDYLKKLVEELVDNAFKFSEPGQIVKVILASDETDYRLGIQDHGRGMTDDQIQHIGAYMQFNRKLYEQQGSGLGLVIARRIVDIHAGQFIVDSSENEGTTITVTLPHDNNA